LTIDDSPSLLFEFLCKANLVRKARNRPKRFFRQPFKLGFHQKNVANKRASNAIGWQCPFWT
jgi:hypothetical protein